MGPHSGAREGPKGHRKGWAGEAESWAMERTARSPYPQALSLFPVPCTGPKLGVASEALALGAKFKEAPKLSVIKIESILVQRLK